MQAPMFLSMMDLKQEILQVGRSIALRMLIVVEVVVLVK
jgi:hypothetical protein